MTTHDELIARLTPRLTHDDPGIYLDIPEGWTGLVDSLDLSIAKHYPDYKIAQVKQKFGGLRFYAYNHDGLHDEHIVEPLVRAAEKISFKICQECGEVGALRLLDGSYYITLCDEHAPEDSEKI